MRKSALSLLGAACAVALMASTASAAVVCNDNGDCWRVKEKYTYPPAARVHIYGDDWSFPDAKKYRWKEARPGPGYWNGGVWVGF